MEEAAVRVCVRLLACSYLFILAATFLHAVTHCSALSTAKYHHLQEVYRTSILNVRIVHIRSTSDISEQQGSENCSTLVTTH